MMFSSLESVEVRHEALSLLRSLVDAPRRLSAGLTGIRFWRHDTLVFDYTSPAGQSYYFDLNCTPNGMNLMVGGRNAPSDYTVLGKLGRITTRVRGRQQRQLSWWTKSVDLDLIAIDVVAHMQQSISLMSAYVEPPLRSVPGYWWDHQMNFGDQVAPWLIELITGRPAHNVIGVATSDYGLMTVGSIITDMNRPGLSIWGSGLISEPTQSAIERLRERKPAAIHAVRGMLTRERLTRHLGWEVPEVYGDPAILLSKLYDPVESRSLDKKLCIVPHYAHFPHFRRRVTNDKMSIVNVKDPVEKVVAEIANSMAVVSTSLHGIIIAQAYGVPWAWLRITDKKLVGDQFKFEDFFSLLERDRVSSVFMDSESVCDREMLSAFESAVLPRSYIDTAALMDAFPFSELPAVPGRIVNRD